MKIYGLLHGWGIHWSKNRKHIVSTMIVEFVALIAVSWIAQGTFFSKDIRNAYVYHIGSRVNIKQSQWIVYFYFNVRQVPTISKEKRRNEKKLTIDLGYIDQEMKTFERLTTKTRSLIGSNNFQLFFVWARISFVTNMFLSLFCVALQDFPFYSTQFTANTGVS